MCIRIKKGFRWPEKKIPAMGVPHLKKNKNYNNNNNLWIDCNHQKIPLNASQERSSIS